MKKRIISLIILCLVSLFFFITIVNAAKPADFEAGGWQKVTKTFPAFCGGSIDCGEEKCKNEPSSFKAEFPIPDFDAIYDFSYDCTFKKKCLGSDLSGTCEANLYGGLRSGTPYTEPQTLIITCYRCFYGEFCHTAVEGTCTVSFYQKSYESCENYCTSIRGEGSYGRIKNGDCACSCSPGYEETRGDDGVTKCLKEEKEEGEEEEEEEEKDICNNGKLDSGEERIDCGGLCPPCDYFVKLSPSNPTLFANGRDTQEFTITAKHKGKPAEGLSFNVDVQDVRSTLSIFSSAGSLSTYHVTTDANGQASFTYTAPRAPEDKYFERQKMLLSVSGSGFANTYIYLKDPKPIISVKFLRMSMLEGDVEDMNTVYVTIEDEDSKEWSIKVTTSIGGLSPVGRSGTKLHTLLDKTNSKEYKFIWNPPVSGVELLDSYMIMVEDQKADWAGLEGGLLDATKGAGLNLLSEGGGLVGGSAKIKSEIDDYTGQYETWKGNVEQITRDINRMKTSTSKFEVFLRSISLGVEGLQTFYGTKGFVESKLGEDDDNLVMSFLKSVRDKVIDYGCDSLQTGLRVWAALERESNLNTVKIPVNVIVDVTDEDGFKGHKNKVFQYTYYINPNE